MDDGLGGLLADWNEAITNTHGLAPDQLRQELRRRLRALRLGAVSFTEEGAELMVELHLGHEVLGAVFSLSTGGLLMQGRWEIAEAVDTSQKRVAA